MTSNSCSVSCKGIDHWQWTWPRYIAIRVVYDVGHEGLLGITLKLGTNWISSPVAHLSACSACRCCLGTFQFSSPFLCGLSLRMWCRFLEKSTGLALAPLLHLCGLVHGVNIISFLLCLLHQLYCGEHFIRMVIMNLWVMVIFRLWCFLFAFFSFFVTILLPGDIGHQGLAVVPSSLRRTLSSVMDQLQSNLLRREQPLECERNVTWVLWAMNCPSDPWLLLRCQSGTSKKHPGKELVGDIHFRIFLFQLPTCLSQTSDESTHRFTICPPTTPRQLHPVYPLGVPSTPHPRCPREGECLLGHEASGLTNAWWSQWPRQWGLAVTPNPYQPCQPVCHSVWLPSCIPCSVSEHHQKLGSSHFCCDLLSFDLGHDVDDHHQFLSCSLTTSLTRMMVNQHDTVSSHDDDGQLPVVETLSPYGQQELRNLDHCFEVPTC